MATWQIVHVRTRLRPVHPKWSGVFGGVGLSRAAAATAVLVVVIFGANCHLVFQAEPVDPPASLFFGCYIGLVTDPPESGKVRVILEPAGEGSGLIVSGCFESGPVVATLAGSLEEGSTETLFVSAMPSGSGPFSLRVTRLPSGAVQATAIDIENINGGPFRAALGLPACAASEVVSCADLGLPMAFVN